MHKLLQRFLRAGVQGRIGIPLNVVAHRSAICSAWVGYSISAVPSGAQSSVRYSAIAHAAPSRNRALLGVAPDASGMAARHDSHTGLPRRYSNSMKSESFCWSQALQVSML